MNKIEVYIVSLTFVTLFQSLDNFRITQVSIPNFSGEEKFLLGTEEFNLRRVYLKAFFDFLVRENVIEKNPVDFKKRKDEGRARAIPIEVLKELLNAPDKKSYAGFRDYCLILFMLDTGIRPGEALKLKKEDFNLASFEVTIPDNVAKTRKKRTLPLSPVVAKEIKKLLFLQPLEWRDTTVFCGFEGKELSTASFGRRLKEYSHQIGYKITP